MKKMRKMYVAGLAGLFVFCGSQLAGAQDLTTDGYYHNPSPEEIAAEQPEVYNEETGEFEVPLALGDALADLVYTPVTPCRMVDTRNGAGAFAGPIAGGTTINVDQFSPNYSAQGGDGTGCEIFDNNAALVVSITAVSPSANGYITAWPYLATMPTVSVLNPRAGVTINNTTVVPQDISGANPEMSIFTSATTHIVVDVLGYFAPPVAAPPSQYVTASTEDTVVAGGNLDQFSPACPAGYRLTGGGGGRLSYSADVAIVTSRPANGTSVALASGSNVADRWLCQWHNYAGTSQDVWCQSICIRVP